MTLLVPYFVWQESYNFRREGLLQHFDIEPVDFNRSHVKEDCPDTTAIVWWQPVDHGRGYLFKFSQRCGSAILQRPQPPSNFRRFTQTGIND
jgi:hypothetical protein